MGRVPPVSYDLGIPVAVCDVGYGVAKPNDKQPRLR